MSVYVTSAREHRLVCTLNNAKSFVSLEYRCRMFADTDAELDAMALRIGCNATWAYRMVGPARRWEMPPGLQMRALAKGALLKDSEFIDGLIESRRSEYIVRMAERARNIARTAPNHQQALADLFREMWITDSRSFYMLRETLPVDIPDPADGAPADWMTSCTPAES